MPGVIRIVLDTNVWLDWLVFYDPCVEPLREAQAAGRAAIFLDAGCEAELVRVLAYDRGRRSLDARAQAAALARCHAVAGFLPPVPDPAAAHAPMQLPACRDRDDQKFLELALAAGARDLVTKDKALLELARRPLPFRILEPASWRLGENGA
ncbi:MAG: PIN domain-containing protein [Burkholderiales bacterium]